MTVEQIKSHVMTTSKNPFCEKTESILWKLWDKERSEWVSFMMRKHYKA